MDVVSLLNILLDKLRTFFNFREEVYKFLNKVQDREVQLYFFKHI